MDINQYINQGRTDLKFIAIPSTGHLHMHCVYYREQ